MMDVPLGDRAEMTGWAQIYVQDNVTDDDAQLEPPAYQQAYYDAWLVG